MRPAALLDQAAALLQRVLRFEHPADRVVADFFRGQPTLGMRERHALADTAYTVLRERLLQQHLAATGTGPIERRLAMLAWQGDSALLRAALTEAERAWLEGVATLDRAGLPAPLRHNLPDWIAAPLAAKLGDGFWPLVEALARPAPLDLRVNVMKARREQVQSELQQAGIAAKPTPLSPLGLRVDGKPALTRLGLFERGEVEVQDEGSQLLALLLEARRGEMVVDFCAGAGGKTLALGAAMRNTGRLYAFDTSGHRLAALKPRLARCGLDNVHPVQIAHERDERIQRLAGKIDRVLVDAPCSGLGTLRRNPDLRWRHTAETVAALVHTQRAILASAARLLKPGGRLVYATCSLLDAENDAIAAAFLSSSAERFALLPIDQVLGRLGIGEPGRLTENGFQRLWPHRHDTDGFFAAAWQRH